MVALLAAGAVVLYLDLPVTRRLVARGANRVLLPVFRGRLTIEHLGSLGFHGIDGARVRVFDPGGQPVLVAEGVHARLATLKLIRSLLFSPDAVDVDISDASIDHVDLLLDTDDAGVPLVAHAFTPVSDPGALTPKTPPRAVLVVLSHARVRQAWIHGRPIWGPPVDLDLRDVDAKVVVQSAKSPVVQVDVRHASLGARGLPLASEASGEVRGRVLVPSERGHAVGIVGSLTGTFAGVEHAARLSLDGDLLSVTIDLKEVDPERVRSFVPGYPLRDFLSAHLEARGSLPHLDLDMRAKLRGGGSLTANGWTDIADRKTMKIHASLGEIDLRGLASGSLPSSLGGDVDATIVLDAESNVTGQISIVSKWGTLGAYVLPAFEVKATFAHDARAGDRAQAVVAVQDPGVTGACTLRLSPKGTSYALAFDASAQAPRIKAVSRFRLPLQGSARAWARGTLDLDTFALSADLGGEAARLFAESAGSPDVQVTRATVAAHASGVAFLPIVEAKVHADAVRVGTFHSDTVEVTVRGAVTAPHVHAVLAGGNVPDVDADADVALGATALFRRLRIGLSRTGDAAEIRAEQVHLFPGGLSGSAVDIQGLGGPARGSFRVTPHVVELEAKSDDVDLARLARLFGAPEASSRGRLSFDVEAQIHPGRAEGRATVDVRGASLGGVAGIAAHADLALGDRRLRGRIHAELGDIGTADFVAENLQMERGGAASLRAWQRIWGNVELSAGLDLTRLSAALPKDIVPLGALRGRLDVEGRLKRISMSADAPQLALSLRTSGLEVVGRTPSARGEGARSPPPWTLEGVDLGIDARIDGETGFAELAARVTDAKGPLVALDAKSAAMPYAALVARPESAWDLVSKVALEARIAVPKRSLATFPRALDVPVEGVFGADLAVHGTLADPSLDLRATLDQASASSTRISLPVDLELALAYGAGHADARLTAESARRGEVLDAAAQFEGRLTELVAGRGGPWRADARAHMERFPLGAVGSLEDRQVRGDLSGDIALKGLYEDASLTVDLGVEGMQIGEVPYKEARIRGVLDGRALDVTATVDHSDGSASAHAHAGAAWGGALWPRLDASQPLEASLVAHDLRAETFLPFAHETLAELEGRIDGKADIRLDPRDSRPRLDGKVTLQHGKFEMSSALGEFHDATATLVLTPDGVATLQNATASGVTGKVEVGASARLNGLSLGSARANIEIPRQAAIPVTVEGAPLGVIDGSMRLTEDPTPDGRGIKIGVDVPRLHVQLPQSGSRSVQSLGELEAAHIQARRGADVVPVALGPIGEPKVRAADARRIEIAVRLGNDVEVRRGSDLQIGLGGQPAITITDTARVSGQLVLEKGGTLDVEGKSFEIESGTVTFVGDDPSNPQIVVTAGWNAPDGTRIYADYIGPLKTGKVTFRSEPSLAQSDIVALLLFGTTEGSSAVAQANSGGASSAYSSVGLAGGVATQPINHALDQFGIHRVAAKVDTSLASNPKPEVELQVAKDISLQLAYVLGTPPPGTNPDTTLLTLNWRFLKSWSLGTTVGSSGTSIIDMIWQRRY
jgi:translocation and assembly module TamB